VPFRKRDAAPGGKKSTQLMLFAASDLHGSETCWRKFLNSGRQFNADVLLLNGDVAGKILVPFERRGSGYVCWFRGEQLALETGAELEAVSRTARQAGQYPYRAAGGEVEELQERDYLEKVFRRVIRASVSEWLELAEEKLRGTPTRLLVMPGNDDPPDVAEVLAEAGVENPEGQIVDVDDQHQMVALGYSNITPWHTPRELSEPEIQARLERDFAAVRDPALTIGAIHCPPHDSGLDTAPVLDEHFKIQYDSGHVRMGPVGSTAVRAVLERFQPLTSVHGHIHESAGVCKLGGTVAINPGSDYDEGVLRGVLVSISGARVRGHQFING